MSALASTGHTGSLDSATDCLDSSSNWGYGGRELRPAVGCIYVKKNSHNRRTDRNIHKISKKYFFSYRHQDIVT